jgi:hypothetical protein
MSGRSDARNGVSVCAACGYPTLGSDVCYYCRPLVATAVRPFPRAVAGPGTDVDGGVASGPGSILAAAG